MASFYELGYRLLGKDKDMNWMEFTSILRSLGPESPLGRIVQIRLETNKDTLKYFDANQKRIQSEWKSFRAKKLMKQMEYMGKKEKASMEAKEKAFVDALFASFDTKK